MIIDELFESPQQCPECGGISFSDLILAEKKDACYHKVKASAKVWPSAYASGRLVQCRKKGAANYGNKSEGVAEGSLNEYRDQLWTWVQSKFPRTQWPEYVQRDFLYAKAKGNKNQKDLEDFLDEIQRDFGRVRWQLEKLPITLDTFTPKTQRMILSREGGSSNPYQVPKDAERHSLQQKMIQQKGVSEEPIIVAKLSNGYDLIEGWHRTIQHLKEFPQGYTAPAWVGYGATYTSESVGQGVAEGSFKQTPGQQQYGALHSQLQSLANSGQINTPDGKQKAEKMIDTIQQLVDTDPSCAGSTVPSKKIWLSEQGIAETELDEKSVSQAQFRTMAGAAHNPEFARKVGISQDVAQEFNQADKKSNYKKLPARATEGEQQKGADYRDPREVDYDDEYDAMVARVKKLAGLGPMKTTYDPVKRVYKNVPTAQQPKK